MENLFMFCKVKMRMAMLILDTRGRCFVTTHATGSPCQRSTFGNTRLVGLWSWREVAPKNTHSRPSKYCLYEWTQLICTLYLPNCILYKLWHSNIFYMTFISNTEMPLLMISIIRKSAWLIYDLESWWYFSPSFAIVTPGRRSTEKYGLFAG